MTNFRMSALTLAAGFVLSTCAIAQNHSIATPISKAEYKAGEHQADDTYKAAKLQCQSLAGNAKDICMVEAKAQENATKADLEARYKSTEKAWYNARLAVTDGNYSLAKEKCDALAGDAKTRCVNDAKARFGKT